MSMNAKALVLGASGGIGGETARQLVAEGWQVHALSRRATSMPAIPGITWVPGDAMSPDDVRRAAAGCRLILHAVNPPGYRNWHQLVLPMIDATIAAAHATGATILLPGTIYNYGSDACPILTETSPQHPDTAKGAIRAEMERRLQRAADGGVRSIVLRAGDFFGPRPGNNWFSQCLVQPGRPVRRVIHPGRPGIGHQWTYLPDMAATFLRLVAIRDRLPAFTTLHMAGHWDPDGTAMTTAIARAAGRPVRIRRLPWRMLGLAAPFVPLIRNLREMRHLWQMPIRMSNDRLLALIGVEPHTPLDEAVRRTLTGLGCLPPAQTSQPG
ncbi:NAD(P)H-binding protein [Tistrella mobilis]|uniref:NAD(P)H-binding protein n=1 Tax=Tistrella mobilis TaxID=171437 RepID=UPI0035577A90